MNLVKHRAALVAAIAAGTLLAGPALAQTAPPAMISVTGEATVSVPPDLAQIDAGVTTEAKTAREASDANNAAMGKVLLALKGAGIEEKDYQTSRLSLQPESAPNRTAGPATIVGYRASNRVTIRLRDVTKVASAIDTLVGLKENVILGHLIPAGTAFNPHLNLKIKHLAQPPVIEEPEPIARAPREVPAQPVATPEAVPQAGS